MLSCYVLANTVWIAIAAEYPATINVNSINSIRPLYGYEDSYTVIDSGYRSTRQIPTDYDSFMIQFNDCLKQVENQK